MVRPDETASAGGHDTTIVAGDTGRLLTASGPLASGAARPAYRVIDEVGRGGMGAVVRAEDPQLGREVAIKRLVRSGPAARARFEREARITARLQHPAIVPVYEAGIDEQGEPFYAMRLVSGRTLADAIRTADRFDARLGLLRHVGAVADAVAYAHSQRVIHRDLKASNVVLGEFGETIVIDWGLAKDLRGRDDVVAATGVDEAGDSALTADGTVMGTPAYMAPEQARGDTVDERADVYAIGAMLYHVLAGALPYGGDTAAEVLAAVRAGPPRPIAARVPEVPRDLATIVDRAMARLPGQRYPTARELARELTRFQDGQLVAAHAYSARELVGRWLRRHRAVVSVAGVALLVAVLGGVVAVGRIIDERAIAEVQRDQALRARADAVARADDAVLARARAVVEAQPAEALELLRTLSPGSPRWAAARLIVAEAIDRGVGRTLGQLTPGRAAVRVSGDGGLLAASGDRLLHVSASGDRWTERVDAPALAADGTAYAWIDGDQAVVGTTSGARRRIALPAGTSALAMTPGGTTLLAVARGRLAKLTIGANQWTPIAVVAPEGGSVDFSHVGERAVGVGVVQRGSDGEPLYQVRGWTFDGVALGGEGVLSLVTSADHLRRALVRAGELVVQDGAGERVLAQVPEVATTTLSRSGAWLAWAELGTPAVHVRGLDAAVQLELEDLEVGMRSLAFSPDDRWLASGGDGGIVRVWDLVTTGPAPSLVVDVGEAIAAIAVDPHGRVTAVTESGLVQRWTVPRRRSWAARVRGASPDQRWTVSEEDHGFVATRVDDGTELRLPLVAPPTNGYITPVQFAEEAAVVVVADGRDLVRWDLVGDTHERFPIGVPLVEVGLSHDGTRGVAIGEDGHVWLAGPGGARRVASGASIHAAARFSPDGHFLQVDERVLRVADGAPMPVSGDLIAFARDGREVAVGGPGSRRCRLPAWVCEPLAAGDAIERLLYGRSGELFAVRRGTEVVRWERGSRTAVLVTRHRTGVHSLSLAPDGRTLVTAADDGVRVTSVESGEQRQVWTHGRVGDVHHDGHAIRIASGGVIVEVPDDLPQDEAGLRASIDAALAP